VARVLTYRDRTKGGVGKKVLRIKERGGVWGGRVTGQTCKVCERRTIREKPPMAATSGKGGGHSTCETCGGKKRSRSSLGRA